MVWIYWEGSWGKAPQCHQGGLLRFKKLLFTDGGKKNGGVGEGKNLTR
jgi:hypothetical protein